LSPLTFLNFWAQYGHIHESNLYFSEKYQYLLQSLKGKARKIVESSPPSPKNLEKAVKQLYLWFGRKELQIEVRIKNLLKIVLSSSNNKFSLSNLYDRINREIQAYSH